MIRIQVVSEDKRTKSRLYSQVFVLGDDITPEYSSMIEFEVKAYRILNPEARVLVLFENLEVEDG
jgi:hypothetical protein